eukprot:jgi/Chlat1/8269/Chrsp78S07694
MQAAFPCLPAVRAVVAAAVGGVRGGVAAGRTPLLTAPRPGYRTAVSASFAGMATAVAVNGGEQMRLMHSDECILVTEDDQVVGHDSKYNCHLNSRIEAGQALHRAFSVFLFDHEYRLLLQRRAPTKITFPLVWTNTCCSHPLYAPSELEEEKQLGVKRAAQRKLEDELGIPPHQAQPDGFTVLGKILYQAPSDEKWGEHEVDYILFMQGKVDVRPNPEEVAEVEYVDQARLKQLCQDSSITLSPWFRLIVERGLLFKYWDALIARSLATEVDLTRVQRLS